MKSKYVYYLTLIFLCLNHSCFSQNVKDTTKYVSVVSLKKIVLGDETGLEWEQKLSKTCTLSLFAGVEFGLSSTDFALSALKTKLGIAPAVYATFKKYYNLQQRVTNKKKINSNSGNFFLFKVDTYFPVENQNYLNILISQGWGIQRSLSKKINFEFELGITEHIFYDNPYRGPYIKLHPIITVLSFTYLF